MITDDNGITMTEHAYSVLNDECMKVPFRIDYELIEYVYVGTVGAMKGKRYYLSPDAHRMRQQLRERYLARISQGLPPHE